MSQREVGDVLGVDAAIVNRDVASATPDGNRPNDDVVSTVDDVADALDVDDAGKKVITTALAEYTDGKGSGLASVSSGALVGSRIGSGQN